MTLPSFLAASTSAGVIATGAGAAAFEQVRQTRVSPSGRRALDDVTPVDGLFHRFGFLFVIATKLRRLLRSQ